MMLLDQVYGVAVAVRNSLYDRDILKTRSLRWPVVSVGNISTGGSGKTPFVIMLAKLLAQRGVSVDVLSRGYRRSTRGVLKVNPQGGADEFGDEPLLIARKLGRPVIVGEDRYASGLEAEDACGCAPQDPMHLLDDGFQHRRLHRDFDIVLLNTEDLNDELLPSGRLREPLSALQRADVVVVDRAFPPELLPRGQFDVWRSERQAQIPKIYGPLIAFCGVARPQRFFFDLRAAGLDIREEIVFRDHHRYTASDTQKLRAAQTRVPGSQLVTTEKDAINLGTHLAVLNPVLIPIHMSLIDQGDAVQQLLGKVRN